MILDYKEYVTEKAHQGVVDYVLVDSGLPLFSHNAVCPFCHTKINNRIYQKSIQIGCLDPLTSGKKLSSALYVVGGSISTKTAAMQLRMAFVHRIWNIHLQYLDNMTIHPALCQLTH